MYDLKVTINKYCQIIELKKEESLRDKIDSKIGNIKYNFFLFLLKLIGMRHIGRL